MTMDDIRGFLQFPPNLEPKEIIFKEYLLGGVLLNFATSLPRLPQIG